MFRVSISILLLSLLVSCSQMSLLTIKSSPDESIVYARAIGSKDRVEIGKTPMQIESTEIAEKIKSSGMIIIEIEKEGYFEEKFYLSEVSRQDIALNISLKKQPKIDQAHNVDLIVQKLFECQQYVKIKRFSDCKEIIKELKKKYPEVSTVHEFEGSIFYLENQKNKALQAFITALKYNDDNREARRMIKVIKDSGE
ncbi:MAG: hypothetical protein CME65_12800 [Halobacteriovoraceae bacterium]|nr:hypothetical protein [Halobacteriovoraceae bacterium]